jgi:hypothetical protein
MGARVHLALAAAAALAGAMVAASSAFADATKVEGSGSSPGAGFLVLSARGDQNTAAGFVRARGSFFGDLDGQVNCIASLPEVQAVVVGGVLETAVSSGGSTSPYFYVRIATSGKGGPSSREFADVVVSTLPLPNCGLPLLFDSLWPSTGAVVTRGNLTVH